MRCYLFLNRRYSRRNEASSPAPQVTILFPGLHVGSLGRLALSSQHLSHHVFVSNRHHKLGAKMRLKDLSVLLGVLLLQKTRATGLCQYEYCLCMIFVFLWYVYRDWTQTATICNEPSGYEGSSVWKWAFYILASHTVCRDHGSILSIHIYTILGTLVYSGIHNVSLIKDGQQSPLIGSSPKSNECIFIWQVNKICIQSFWSNLGIKQPY